MTSHPIYRIWLTMLLGLFLLDNGCAPSEVRTISSPPSPDVLLARLNQATSRLQDLKGSAHVSVSLKDRQGRVSIRFQFRQPDHLKIYVQGAFLQILAVLSIEQETVQLYIPQDNVVFGGTLADNDVVVPGMRVPLSDVRTAVTGLTDLSMVQTRDVMDYGRDGDQYRMTIQDAVEETTRMLWIDPDRSVITREEERLAGGIVIHRSFERYARKNGVWRPGRIRITRVTIEGGSLDLTYDTQTVNSGLTHADLSLTLPRSIRRLPLSQAVFDTE